MNYDPFSREQIFSGFFIFFVYGLHLQVLITVAADEPVYREYRSLYSRDTGRLFTSTISHALRSSDIPPNQGFFFARIRNTDMKHEALRVSQSLQYFGHMYRVDKLLTSYFYGGAAYTYGKRTTP
jgi:hypothetical protein